MKPPSLTIGIEEEYQIIDPETRELRSYITEILEGDRITLEQVKPELHQSIVEVGTNICRTPAEARAELVKLRYFAGLTIEEAADVLGISSPTAKRDWTYARAWLFKAISRSM